MLLGKLKARQLELGLSDVRFADRLGVPRSTWRNAKVGIRRPSRRLVLGAMKAFPDLSADCVSFLLSDGTDVHITSTVVA